MPDVFTNARPYYDVTFPSSGDSFSISNFKNAFQGLGFMDMVPLQPRAHSPGDMRILVRGRDSGDFYNPYYGRTDADAHLFFTSGDTTTMTAPTSNPRIDIIYLTPSGDLRIVTGTEAATPTLPALAPSGDTRLPICAIYHKTTAARIVNFEDRNANSGDSYIYQDLRPFLRPLGSGGPSLSSTAALSSTGDNVAGTATTASRQDHTHQGVHTLHAVGSGDMFGDIEFFGPSFRQEGRRLTIGGVVQVVNRRYVEVTTGTTTLPNDDTIPQNTEGDEYMTAPPIAAKSTLNKFRIDAVGIFASTSGTEVFTMALFQDNIAGALAAVQTRFIANDAPLTLKMTHYMTADTISSITFKIRAGTAGAGTTTFNGSAGARRMGGVMASNITITEIVD